MKLFSINPLKFSTPQSGGHLRTASGSGCIYYLSKDDAGFWWSVDGVVSIASSEAAAIEAINHDHQERLLVAFLDEVKP